MSDNNNSGARISPRKRGRSPVAESASINTPEINPADFLEVSLSPQPSASLRMKFKLAGKKTNPKVYYSYDPSRPENPNDEEIEDLVRGIMNKYPPSYAGDGCKSCKVAKTLCNKCLFYMPRGARVRFFQKIKRRESCHMMDEDGLCTLCHTEGPGNQVCPGNVWLNNGDFQFIQNHYDDKSELIVLAAMERFGEMKEAGIVTEDERVRLVDIPLWGRSPSDDDKSDDDEEIIVDDPAPKEHLEKTNGGKSEVEIITIEDDDEATKCPEPEKPSLDKKNIEVITINDGPPPRTRGIEVMKGGQRYGMMHIGQPPQYKETIEQEVTKKIRAAQGKEALEQEVAKKIRTDMVSTRVMPPRTTNSPDVEQWTLRAACDKFVEPGCTVTVPTMLCQAFNDVRSNAHILRIEKLHPGHWLSASFDSMLVIKTGVLLPNGQGPVVVSLYNKSPKRIVIRRGSMLGRAIRENYLGYGWE